MGYRINDDERDALYDMAWMDRILYHAIRACMDWETGLVGVSSSVSWRGFQEELQVPVVPGKPGTRVSKPAVRRAAKRLEAAGLLQILTEDDRRLVFNLPIAERGRVNPSAGGPTHVRHTQGDTKTDTQKTSKIIDLPRRSDTNPDTSPTHQHRHTSGSQVNTSTSDEVLVDEKPSTRVPYQKIVSLYNEHCAPWLPAVQVMNNSRRKAIGARWKDDPKHQSVDFWSRFFAYVARSDFLMGREKEWAASFDWLLKPTNFAKVIEGNYHRESSAR